MGQNTHDSADFDEKIILFLQDKTVCEKNETSTFATRKIN